MTFDKSEGALVECQGEADRVAYGFSSFPGALCVPVDSPRKPEKTWPS